MIVARRPRRGGVEVVVGLGAVPASGHPTPPRKQSPQAVWLGGDDTGPVDVDRAGGPVAIRRDRRSTSHNQYEGSKTGACRSWNEFPE